MPRFQAHERPPPSSSLPVGESLFSDALHFQAHQPAPLSSSPPESEPSFVMCHVSKLTNPLLPLPPLQQVSPRISLPTFPLHPPPPSPPASKSLFVTCHVSKLTNPLLPLPLLQEVSANASAQSPQSCGSELLSPHITVHVPPIVGDHKRDVQVHLFLSFTFSLVKHVISDRFLHMG